MKIEVVASNIEILTRLRERVKILPREASRAWASRIEQIVKMYMPIRTGRLRSELRIEPHGDGLTMIAPKYLLYLVSGTRPHEILPRRARALRFEIEGRIVLAKRVYHPGFPPQPFFKEALERAFEILPGIIVEVLRNA